MPGCDRDLVRPLEKRLKARYEQILLGTQGRRRCEAVPRASRVIRGEGAARRRKMYDRVLVAVGRVPNGEAIAAERRASTVNERGFIPVDKQMRTNVPHIFAIGDIVGQPMLAHKATHEGKVAAEVAAGHKAFFDARVIPSVAYTDPEVAWVGVTETAGEARRAADPQGGVPVGGQRPLAFAGPRRGIHQAAGRSRPAPAGDRRRHRGPNAGELIAEVALAIEIGADAADVGLTIHPHPTLSESVGMTAEALEGTLTDLYVPKKGS